MIKRPNSRVNLDKAIERIFGKYEKSIEIRSIMANTIVGHMLPDAVVKGGSSLKLRYGNSRTRVTMDLDMACRNDIASFVAGLNERLSVGWNGFAGKVVEREPAKPKDVPQEYVMHPYAVKLTYMGQSWCTVDLELGANEIGDANEADFGLAQDVAEIFQKLDFPVPDKVPLMKLEYQIAQKIHGVTEPGSRRAHDLIDLQLMMESAEIDFSYLNAICKRLFAYRKRHSWPANVEKGPDWELIYNEENSKPSVCRTVDEAIVWGNELIRKIAASSS
jgi:hypothetical protein